MTNLTRSPSFRIPLHQVTGASSLPRRRKSLGSFAGHRCLQAAFPYRRAARIDARWEKDAGNVLRTESFAADAACNTAYDAADNLVTEQTKRYGKDFSKRLQIIGFEQNYSNSASTGTTWQLQNTRILIDTPTGLAGSFTWSPDNTGTRRYFHHDYLGSLCLVTNEAGDIETRFSYAPFGNARDPLTWQHLDDPIADHASSAANLGYGGHRMFRTFGLVHMGGRVYDPTLGRFLSPDPVVQLPHHTQNHNRYSYVLNNPLSLTDPTGNFIQFIPAIIYALGYLTTTQLVIMTMVATFGSVLIAGGSVSQAFKAAMIAGATAVVASVVGQAFGGSHVSLFEAPLTELARAAVHGITSGGFSELGGGDFKSGFAAGFTSSMMGSLSKTGAYGRALNGDRVLQVTAAALAGGTSSSLSGGKFANGAFTAALIEVGNNQGGANSGSVERERTVRGTTIKHAISKDGTETVDINIRAAFADKNGWLSEGNSYVRKWVEGVEEYWSGQYDNISVSVNVEIVSSAKNSMLVFADLDRIGTEQMTQGAYNFYYYKSTTGWGSAHEVGHWFGLGHDDFKGHIMYRHGGAQNTKPHINNIRQVLEKNFP